MLHSVKGNGANRYILENTLKPGVNIIKVTTKNQKLTRKLIK
ncbi:MAG: T9SS type A sorting domain-containing protein [Flavobacteriales bacterium]|nr:T9SS type A sorting domain-containing protein [Flavobacteriales bacterium]